MIVLVAAARALAQQPQVPADRLRDRGAGVPLSMFGSYLEKGQFLVYPFFEYYRNGDYEYEPGERWKIAGVEGSEDEAEFISEAQVFLTQTIVLKLNNAFGITPKATDWAPEVGLMCVIP